jgi:hypothetical protein
MINKPLSQQLREYYEKYPLDDEFVYSFADELEDQEKELNELKAWKEGATEVMDKLQLQEIGKELELPLGSDIASQVLPIIKYLVKDDYAKEVTKCYSQLKDEFDQWKSIAEELAKHLSRWYPAYGFCVDNEANIALRNFEKLKQNDL